MNEPEKKRKEPEKKEELPSNQAEPSPEMIRRKFIKRFGPYSAGTCTSIFVLMSARTSQPPGSDGAR